VAVRNVHERSFTAAPSEVGALLDTLASSADQLWPHDRWPAIRFDGPLAPGAAGGHGPIRYTVEEYEPGRRVSFRFTRPRGFRGGHAFVVEARRNGGAVLRHELVMQVAGTARLTWPVVFRPLHDALIEDALDRAAAALDGASPAARWTRKVRALRAMLRWLHRSRAAHPT
jgi:hypothetical protein